MRRAAARSLGQIGASALPALEKAAADDNAEKGRGAVEAMAWIGVPAVPELIAVLGGRSPTARAARPGRWDAWDRRPRPPRRR